MTNLIGQSLGRYHILEQLGEGGMATVYKAFDTRLESDVAVKVIRTDTLAPNVLSRALKRFEREAKALARLTHANIVKVSDYGEYEGHPFLVMPYLPGGNLKERLKKGPLPWLEAVKLLEPVARALEYAHSMGVIHRDVKPSNILITKSGDPMLTDFGVAKVVEEEVTVDLTGTAMAVGTPEYMAPEQATSKSVDHRADIYALGVVLYEMVTGRKPFVADTPLAVLIKQASEPLPRPTQFVSALPDKVEKIILKALAKKPGDRFQTMGDFAVALERCLAEATSEKITGKSIQAEVKPVRNGRMSGQVEKARVQLETPPIAARAPAAATCEKISKPQPETLARGSSSKRVILISAIIVLVAAVVGFGYYSTYHLWLNDPAAFVYGEKITIADVQKEVRWERMQLIASYNRLILASKNIQDPVQAQVFSSQASQTESVLNNKTGIGDDALEFLIEAKIARHEAVSRGIAVTEDELQARVNEVLGYIPEATLNPTITRMQTLVSTTTPLTQAAFQKYYALYLSDVHRMTKMTEMDFRERVRSELYIEKVKNAVMAEVPRNEDQVHLAQIVVADEATAQAVYARVAVGESWDWVAKEVSLDTATKDTGGDLGWIAEGNPPSDLEKAAFAMNYGQIIQPIQTSATTWVILKLLDKGSRPMSADKYASEQQPYYQQWLQDIRNKPGVLDKKGIPADLIPIDPKLQTSS
jgi:serine/threonine protein kinase/parvulin-like peptidyl-prolyl isomerase